MVSLFTSISKWRTATAEFSQPQAELRTDYFRKKAKQPTSALHTSRAPACNKKSAALVCRPCFFLFRRYARIHCSLPLLHCGAAPIESYASVLCKYMCECARTWILLLPLRFNLGRHISIVIGCPPTFKRKRLTPTARFSGTEAN